MIQGQWSRNNFRITPNAEQVPIQVVGSSTFGRYDKVASGLTYNMYISDGWLINFAGYKRIKEFVTNNEGEGRGAFHSTRGNFVIVVINASVFRVANDFSLTLVGTIGTTAGEVFIDENLSNQICIVDGEKAYIYNYVAGGGLVDQNLPFAPNYVCFHNTFFLFGNAENSLSTGAAWYVYGFNTTTTLTQITQLTLSTKPDFALAVIRLPGQGNNVIVFGKTVCEIWTQIGGNQNYRRNASININYGCLSISTIATSDQYTAWLAVNEDNSPIILAYSAEGLKRISSDGIDYLMDNIQYPDQSTAFFYTQDGHLFYQLTFYNDADNITLIYDFNTEKFFNLSDHDGGFHPARKMVYFNRNPYFISLKNASMYQCDTSLTTYNENLSTDKNEWDSDLNYPIARTRVCETIRKPDSGRFVANSFVFTMAQGYDTNVTDLALYNQTESYLISENGIQLVSEEGVFLGPENALTPAYHSMIFDNPDSLAYRPRVDMAISKDSGTSWSNYVSRGLNTVGNRQNIITWNNLGRCNELNIKLRFWGLSSFQAQNGFVEVY